MERAWVFANKPSLDVYPEVELTPAVLTTPLQIATVNGKRYCEIGDYKCVFLQDCENDCCDWSECAAEGSNPSLREQIKVKGRFATYVQGATVAPADCPLSQIDPKGA